MFENFALEFINPKWLWLLPIVLLVCWLFARYRDTKSMWSKLCDPHLLAVLMPASLKAKTDKSLTWVVLVMLVLLVLAASGPSWRKESVPLFETVAARVIVLDLSASMLAQDVAPTRFKRAVFKAKDMINHIEEGQTGLIVFAGSAFLVSPLTDDKQTLVNFLDSVSPQIMPVQGNRVDLAITMAQQLLLGANVNEGQIYLLSDGVNDLSTAIDRLEDIDKVDVNLSVLAFGSEQGGPIKDSRGKLVYDQSGELVIAKVDFNQLEQLAEQGGGRYAQMTADQSDVRYLLATDQNVDPNQTQESDNNHLKLPVNDGVWLVLLALPLALWLFRRNALWLLVLLILPMPKDAKAFDWSSLWHNKQQQSVQAYQNGDYDQALELSKDSQLKAAAQYQLQAFDQAEQLFAQSQDARGFYNLGNALAQQQKFQKAIEAYQQALQLQPDHQAAEKNKQLIEEFLKQQDQQQSDDQEQDQNQNQQNESQDQSDSQQSNPNQDRSSEGSSDDDLQEDSTQESEQQPQVEQDEPNSNPADQAHPQNEQAQSEQQQAQDPQTIDRWINRLPDDPSELLRRKFLRDYQRQTKQ